MTGNSVLPSSSGQGPHSRRTAHLDQERGNCAGGRSCPAQWPKPSLHCWSPVQPRVPMTHQRRVIPCRSSCFRSGVVREAEKHPHRRQVRLFQQRTDALTVNTRQRPPAPVTRSSSTPESGSVARKGKTWRPSSSTSKLSVGESDTADLLVAASISNTLGPTVGCESQSSLRNLRGVVHGTIAPAPLSSACILSATSARRDDGTRSLPRVAFRTVGDVWSHWFCSL